MFKLKMLLPKILVAVVTGRKWGWVALYSITIFFPTMYLHNIIPMQAAHAAKFSGQQPFRRKFMMSKQEKCVQKSVEMFYTLIWCFECLFPKNDQIWGHFLHFLTQQIIWQVAPSPIWSRNNPPSYLHKRVGDLWNKYKPQGNYK